jgi:hypothetical protein
LRDPYEVMGMKPGASKDEVKRRYDILLRRYRAFKMDPDGPKVDFDIDEVNAAYNNIMGYDIKFEDPNAGRKRPFLRMMKIDPAKWDNFWTYNRTKVIIGLLSVFFVVYFIISIINNKPSDFHMKVLGDIYISEESKTTTIEMINNDLEAVENAFIDTLFFGDSEDPTYDMAIIQKIMAELAARELDIMLCDKEKFENYLKQGVFLPLDEFFPIELLEENSDYYFSGTVNEDEEISGYFGIDVSGYEFFADFIPLEEEKELIFSIVINTKRVDVVREFIDRYILIGSGG